MDRFWNRGSFVRPLPAFRPGDELAGVVDGMGQTAQRNHLRRQYRNWVLNSLLRRFANDFAGNCIVEIGDANGSFLRGSDGVILHLDDLLEMKKLEAQADLVFNIGSVSGLDGPAASEAIDAHFRLLRKGGLVLICYSPSRRKVVLNALRTAGELILEKTLWPFYFTERFAVARKA